MGGVQSKAFFKESVPTQNNSTAVLLNFFQRSGTIAYIFVKGFYNPNLIKNFLGVNPSSTTLPSPSLNNRELYFNEYGSIFSSLTHIRKSNHLNNKSFLGLVGNPARGFMKVFLSIFLISSLIFIVLYFSIIFSYKANTILPNFLSFTVTNMTIFFFSFVTSSTFLETQLIPLILSIIRVNYNNLEANTLILKFQEKYFSKLENTYFTDKKCNEAWVTDYYVPSDYLFKGRASENFYNNLGDSINLSPLLGLFNNSCPTNLEEQFLSYKFNYLPLNFKSIVLGFHCFETRSFLKLLEYKELSPLNHSVLSPLNLKVNTVNTLSSVGS